MAPSSLVFFLLGVSFTILVYRRFLSSHQQPSGALYPPGPNVVDMPVSKPWHQFQAWGREYGKLVYIRSRNMLIINDSQTAIDLLEKRARIYSDRPVTPLMELYQSELVLSLKRYSPQWRRDRKLFQQNFRQAAASRFFPAQYTKVHEYLRNLTNSPEKFMQHTMGLSQRLVYASLYGLDIGPDHPIARESVKTVEIIGRTITPGFYPWAERFPWLRFMPGWFPGCGFRRDIEECRKSIREINTIPFDMAVNNSRMGHGSSLLAELAAKEAGNPAQIEAIKSMGTISFLASADTTMSSVSSALLCMTLYPEVQIKGQEEIDLIVGRDRLPTFEDRPSLPYIESIYREVMRMHPPLPLGLSHSSIEDDLYHGYHIPKGCTVIPNVWAMNRDSDKYSQPEKFIPERFLDAPNGPFGNINDIRAFGFGRRVCSGRYMAENTIWLTIASVLATLTIGKPKDSEGNEINVPGEYTDTFLSHPMPFECSIAPRTPYAKELILATASE